MYERLIVIFQERKSISYSNVFLIPQETSECMVSADILCFPFYNKAIDYWLQYQSFGLKIIALGQCRTSEYSPLSVMALVQTVPAESSTSPCA